MTVYRIHINQEKSDVEVTTTAHYIQSADKRRAVVYAIKEVVGPVDWYPPNNATALNIIYQHEGVSVYPVSIVEIAKHPVYRLGWTNRYYEIPAQPDKVQSVFVPVPYEAIENIPYEQMSHVHPEIVQDQFNVNVSTQYHVLHFPGRGTLVSTPDTVTMYNTDWERSGYNADKIIWQQRVPSIDEEHFIHTNYPRIFDEKVEESDDEQE
jgi:hypothetical protein